MNSTDKEQEPRFPVKNLEIDLLERAREARPLDKTELHKLEAREETKRGIPSNTLIRSFGFAFQGIFYVIRTQRNMQIHLAIGALAVLAAILFGISSGEWAALLAVMALVYSLEMVNTVIESIVDMITEEYHPLAKVAKDAAAGAVLVAAIFAVGTGVAIFLPRALHFLFNI